MMTGGCFCRFLRYHATAEPYHETSCHCSVCRRTTGAPFVTWFSVAKSTFRWTAGNPTYFHSSAKGTRAFCPNCGTQITFENADVPQEIDITTCSLDDPEQLPPKDHTRTSSRLSWVKLADRLPQYAEARAEAPVKP
jgi:hypothetical protein